MADIGLNGRVALVTGGSRGIGRGIALELAAAGCNVVLTARDAAALERVAQEVHTLGRKASVHACDLTQSDAPYSVMRAVEQAFGRLDILVNNAGAAKRGNFLEVTDAEWHEGFELKFFGHVRLSRAAWPLLSAAGGSVVFIAGIGARYPVADYMIGSCVVGAELTFMRALADLGKRVGVQVNAINPGTVDTDRFRLRLDKVMAKTGLEQDAAIEHHRAELDVTRFGRPDDVAGLVRFIVSPAGRWLHGTAIDMDGGQIDPLRMSRYD